MRKLYILCILLISSSFILAQKGYIIDTTYFKKGGDAILYKHEIKEIVTPVLDYKGFQERSKEELELILKNPPSVDTEFVYQMYYPFGLFVLKRTTLAKGLYPSFIDENKIPSVWRDGTGRVLQTKLIPNKAFLSWFVSFVLMLMIYNRIIRNSIKAKTFDLDIGGLSETMSFLCMCIVSGLLIWLVWEVFSNSLNGDVGLYAQLVFESAISAISIFSIIYIFFLRPRLKKKYEKEKNA